jgi:hypothetical protein
VTGWTAEDLERIGGADELEIASTRPDGTLRPYVTIWVVRAGDGLYVRSAHGSDNPWYRRAVASGTGRIRAGGAERDAGFESPDHALDQAITKAFHEKYDRYGAELVDPVVSSESAKATLRILPRP